MPTERLAEALVKAGAKEPCTQHSGSPDTERLTLLVDACDQLMQAGLEPGAVLERLCELVVPRLGNACHVRLLSEDGLWLRSEASAHPDPEVRDLMRCLTATPHRADEGPPARVLSTGRAVLLSLEELSHLWRLPTEHPHRAPPPSSLHLLMVPLRARQRPLGILTLYREAEGAPFEPGEQLLLQELADRAGLALDAARTHEAERRARHAAEVVAERLTRLQRVTEALGEALTPSDVACVIVEEMISAIGASRALVVAPLPEDPEQLGLIGHRAVSREKLERLPCPPSARLPVAVAYRTGEPVWLESCEALSTFSEDLVSEPGVTQAVVALPLRTRGRTLGAVSFGFDSRRTFSTEERSLLLDLARQSAQALERAWLYEAAQQARTRAERVAARTARLRTLHTALSQVLTASRVAEVVIEQGQVATGAQVGGLWLMDPSGTWSRLQHGVGLPPAHDFPWEDALQRGQPVWLESGESSLARSLACLPLVVDGHSLGGLVFGFHGAHHFDDDERVFLTLLAHQAAQALERARLFAQEQRAREALRDAHQTLKAIVQSSPMAITLLELDGTVRLWNPAAERIFGWKAQEVLGRLTPTVPPGKEEELRDNLARISRGESLLGLETQRLRRDGSVIDVSMWSTGVRVANEQQLCLTVLADITERKRAEQALRDALRLREEFLSIASHELRTPITALQLQLQGLRASLAREPQGLSPERLRRALETVDRQVKRQMNLIHDLLDESQLGADRLVLRPEPLDFAALAREVAERFEPELARGGSRLTVLAPTPVPGSWDRTRLEQVVTNLVSNAVKYGQGNPITLHVEEEGAQVRLLVRDAGIGIAPEHLGRLFGRFERAVSERHYGGFGLGLWISRRIVEAMGGRITVTSEPGVGSTFLVELPREGT